MSPQKLTAFERAVIAGFAEKAGLAAALLEAWADLPANSVQSVRSLIDAAQLGVTEEGATRELLNIACGLGLAELTSVGFVPRSGAHPRFRRLAFALNVVEYYRSEVHRDATVSQVVLTKPPRPCVLEQKLSALGWRTADLEPTGHAFHGLVRSALRRALVMTPFFDRTGALWLQELLALVSPGVERILVLRSLENSNRMDYPAGFDAIASWLREERISVFNYSIPRAGSAGRETFHAKVVLCDRSAAYVGSSNVTSASLEHSLELGVVLHGRAAADVAEVMDAVLEASTKIM